MSRQESCEPIPVFPRIAVYAAAASSSRKRSTRSKIRITCTDDHSPPRAVGMPCSLRPAAMALRLVFPAARSSLMIGARSAAFAAARAQGFYAHCTRCSPPRRSLRAGGLILPALRLRARRPPFFQGRMKRLGECITQKTKRPGEPGRPIDEQSIPAIRKPSG